MKNVNEVKKELYKSKAIAKLISIISGTMYYTVQLEDGLYRFPIQTVDKVQTTLFKLNPNAIDSDIDSGIRGILYVKYEEDVYKLSSDLGTTSFDSEMKGSDLNRWIVMAIEKNEFVKIG